ncbi:hypothetical protein N7540_006153 [Penicillium herquei]|nr:hypothetical protein N7540_006153 [Penicillium herquei]
MESMFSWFCQGPLKGQYVPGAIITTQHPTPSRWKILKVINEHKHQLNKENTIDPQRKNFSFVTTRLECCREDNLGTRVEIRVYLQVPWTNTEFEPSQVRAQQAAEWEPPEFRAYKIMNADAEVSRFTPRLLGYENAKQGNEGYVPSGFHIKIV